MEISLHKTNVTLIEIIELFHLSFITKNKNRRLKEKNYLL